jgi:hypothetical protein
MVHQKLCKNYIFKTTWCQQQNAQQWCVVLYPAALHFFLPHGVLQQILFPLKSFPDKLYSYSSTLCLRESLGLFSDSFFPFCDTGSQVSHLSHLVPQTISLGESL